MEYSPGKIEGKWQEYWLQNKIFYAQNTTSKPKYYVLDMFPYPSGAGLHVGHPVGYIASDIVTRYKVSSGYNVLHPIGFDSFGLPAEQYAIQTGQHPSVTTEVNSSRYISQLKSIGLAYDWSRCIKTSDPEYYKWTQWIFCKLFQSWYDKIDDKAKPISDLINHLEASGNHNLRACSGDVPTITSKEWQEMSYTKKQEFLLNYRLAYISQSVVNWCPELGTVLANDEIKGGVSERGGHPIERRLMPQWVLRISSYADRLLQGLEKLEWSPAIKAVQRNWIGKSEGVIITFQVYEKYLKIPVFTTRPEAIFGVACLCISVDHPILQDLPDSPRKIEVLKFTKNLKNRPEEFNTKDKHPQGIFTGLHVIRPFTHEKIPIWVADYVLPGYGTESVMAVPAHNLIDYQFCIKYGIEITPVISTYDMNNKIPNECEEGYMIDSDFLTGLPVHQAQEALFQVLEGEKIGRKATIYSMKDAVFSRQRYWGEPFPIYYKDKIPHTLSDKQLPLVLPDISSYNKSIEGRSPLAAVKDWTTADGCPLEIDTMPGWAGSSWYYLRYMDPHNADTFVGKSVQNYWRNVDLYIGGSEHATGHLMYARFWTKFLFDLGYIGVDEPFEKLLNQGMIQGRSNLVYKINNTNTYVTYELKDKYSTTPIHVSIDIVHNDKLDIQEFKLWRPHYANAEFILNKNDEYTCGVEVEKMSKSKHNVVTPDEIIKRYGADALRMYTMFLGPIEHSKPWNTNGIDGVYRFLSKLWKLFHAKDGKFQVSHDAPTPESLKTVHKAIKKVTNCINLYEFNTAVSTFMICVNELTQMKCNNKSILENLVVLIAPFAPHIAEELWQKLGNNSSVAFASYPICVDKNIIEDKYEYPISINGKVRTKIAFSPDEESSRIESSVLSNQIVKKWIAGKALQKIVIVPQKIVNIVTQKVLDYNTQHKKRP